MELAGPANGFKLLKRNERVSPMTNLDFGYILQVLPGIIIGFTVHEFAHAFVAFHLGDDTARRMGRYSLNPVRHIDPFGFLLLIIAGFGWAKPVIIDRSKLANPRQDDALIAVAGPFSNLALSTITAAIIKIVLLTIPYEGNVVYSWILNALFAGVYVNLGLFVFNLLPIPPLDGSHVLLQALNIKDEMNVRAFYKYGTFLLLGIILAERGLNIDILPIGKAIRWIGEWLLTMFGLA
jgi:Zn-dependent protease